MATRPPPTALLRTEFRRSTLRLRVILAIIAVALAPQLLVFAWSQLDRYVPGLLWSAARDASVDAAALTAHPELPAAELATVAHDKAVWLRVFDADDQLLAEADFDQPKGRFDRVEAFFLGQTDASSLHDLDVELGPLEARPEVAIARKIGSYVGCRYASVVLCQAIVSVPVSTSEGGGPRLLVVQKSSRRAVQSVYGLRHQLVRLSVVTIPLALVLALYTGRRIVRPIESLRRQVLAKASAATAAATVDPERRDEVGVLAESFNALLLALDQKRTENEAFVADLVHELKNPVSAVRAAAESLSAGGVDAARAERLARVLQDSSGKLDRVVSQFLELARAEAGLPNEERSEVDVAALLGGLLATLRDDPRHARVELTLERSGEGDARVLAVSHRLDSLFRELLENAGSFAGEGGRVEVHVSAAPGEVIVSVSDTGPGILPDDLPRMFTRFFTTRGRARGTGLGLALVRAVAEAHGGRVSARSSPGEGATFEVRLPRAR